MAKLFSYGTLQNPEVQVEAIGRTVTGTRDVLKGYQKTTIEVNGGAYSILVPGNEEIVGVVLDLSEKELDELDIFETSAFRRVEVTLESGTKAWVYMQ